MKVIVISLIAVVVLVAGYWFVSPLFMDNVVDEELPSARLVVEDVVDAGEEMGEKVAGENRVEFSGSFVDADSFHKASGQARVVEIDGKRYLSLEDFEVTNGPDLFVYLSDDDEASNFVNLGRLKGNIGNQNYEISEDVDFGELGNVLIWCRAFGVLFGSAELG